MIVPSLEHDCSIALEHRLFHSRLHEPETWVVRQQKSWSLCRETNHGRVITSLGDAGRTNFTWRAVLASRVWATLRVERLIFLVQYPSV
jgi:hypothetical protein